MKKQVQIKTSPQEKFLHVLNVFSVDCSISLCVSVLLHGYLFPV